MSFDWDKYHEYEAKYLKKSNDNDFLNMWEVNTSYDGGIVQKEPYGFFFNFYHCKHKTPSVSPRDVEDWRSQPERPIKCPERKLEGNLLVYNNFPIATAVSLIRFENPHSLSYHAVT